MDNELTIVCLTDLSDSVASIERLGHDGFLPQVDLFRATTDAFVESTHGTAIKGKGDGDIIVFRSPDKAIRFAALLQAYYKEHPALQGTSQPVRISLFSGVVRMGENDIDGSAINFASRIENLAQAGQVVINDSLATSLRTIWGSDKCNRLITSIGEHPLKGGAAQELFEIAWELFSLTPEESLAGLILNHLKTANVDISNLAVTDLARPGTIIWPAVPRDVVTAIHRGQIEIIRLLAFLGWEVHLLIEDCDGTGELPRTRSDAFKTKVENYMGRRDLRLRAITRLSDYYRVTHESHAAVQDLFRKVTSTLTLQQMQSINKKEYDENKAAQIATSPTLKFLTPALSIAAVIHLAQALEGKVIIVSGADERKQWIGSYSVSNAREKIGAIMHPVLKQDPEYQAFQNSTWPIWDSEGALIQDMTATEPTNLAWWVVNLHTFVPAFPHNHVDIGNGKFPADWPNREQIPDSIQAAEIARAVWPLLNPTS